jgi:hypothetical protein
VLFNSGLQVYIIRCAIRRFVQNGVLSQSSTAGARVFIRDSFIYLNGGSNGSGFGGVNVQGNGTGNIVSIVNTEIDGNQNFAVQANGTGNILGLANSVLNASPVAVSLLNSATAVSFGPSNVVSPAFTFPTTLPFK